MTESIYDVTQELIKPTYLYIKVHSITKLKYFGKTTTKDPEKYKGSGIWWSRHLKKYGRDFVYNELIIGPYTIKSELEALALWMSTELDIVNSQNWANLIPENGINGGSNKGRIGTGGNAKGYIPTGMKVKGMRVGIPANGKAAKGVLRGPGTGANIKGHEKRGKGAKGIPKSGGKAKGMPSTGNNAKGIPKVGNAAKGVLKGPQLRVTCEHCGKVGGVSAMTRHHGNNCKERCTFQENVI